MHLSEALFGAHQTPRDPRIERLIAIARVALVVLALIALAIDPLEPPPTNARIFYILAVYLGLSLVFAVIGFAGWRPNAWKVATHVADVGMAALLIDISALSVSPFFSYFLFVLLAATLRWDARGAIWTTAGAFFLFIAILWMRTPPLDQLSTDPTSPINRAVVQGTFLIVAGALLAFFGRLNERNRDRLAQLAAWPAPAALSSAESPGAGLAVILGHVAAVMKVPRILVLWEQTDEPYIRTATWWNGDYRETRERALIDCFAAAVSPALEAIPFAVSDIRKNTVITSDGVRMSKDPSIDAALASRFAIRSAATARFVGTICHGRVFLLDRSDWRGDDLTLAEIVASRIGIELEQHELRRQVGEIAAVQERIRLARDLHDGILQNLTAVRLQLASAISHADAGDRNPLETAAQVLAEEQRRIRDFVDLTRTRAPSTPIADFDLRADTEDLLAKVRQTWGCEIGLDVRPANATVRMALGREIGFILSEAAANAVQHGQASRIDVVIQKSDEAVLLEIRNDGEAIAGATGAFDHHELAKADFGPRSLRDRIAELRGRLSITNAPDGVAIEVSLPLT